MEIDEEILVRTRRFQSEIREATGDIDSEGDRPASEQDTAEAYHEPRRRHRAASVKKKSGAGIKKPLSALFGIGRPKKKKIKQTKPEESSKERPGYFETDTLVFKRPDSFEERIGRDSVWSGDRPVERSDMPEKVVKRKVSDNNMINGNGTGNIPPAITDPSLGSDRPKKRGEKIKKRGRKRRLLAQIAMCLLLVCAFTLSAAGGAVAAYYKAATNTITTDTEHALRNANVVDADLVSDQDVVNILLIGCDKRQDETATGRSDTTMIATIDIKNGKLKLISLMRDMYIDIPGYGYHKFNAAYSYGGVQLEYETIAQNFGIRLDGYVEVDMAAFREVVDLLGGVPMELTEAEAYFLQTAYVNSKHGEKDVTAGMNMMTPYQALAYCRIRQDVMGEFGRTDRQRKVLISIYDEMKKEDVMTITNICMRALRYVTTDLTEDQIRSYLTSVISMGATEIEQLRIPYEGSYTAGRLGAGGAWVMQTDFEANSAALQYFIFGVGEDPQIDDEYGVGNDRFINGYYPEKTDGISTY